MMNNIAVYGTLVSECYNHFIITNMNPPPKIDDYITGYEIRVDHRSYLPFAVKSKPHHKIKCEIYQITEASVNMLDKFEGNGHMYRRIEVVSESGIPCFLYVGIYGDDGFFNESFTIRNSKGVSDIKYLKGHVNE